MRRNGPSGGLRPRSGCPDVDGDRRESYQSRAGWPPWPCEGEGPMGFRLPHVFLTLAATACALAGPAAYAFTVENKDEGGQYGVPKFNLEEQAKNFRKDGSEVSST